MHHIQTHEEPFVFGLVFSACETISLLKSLILSIRLSPPPWGPTTRISIMVRHSVSWKMAEGEELDVLTLGIPN